MGRMRRADSAAQQVRGRQGRFLRPISSRRSSKMSAWARAGDASAVTAASAEPGGVSESMPGWSEPVARRCRETFVSFDGDSIASGYSWGVRESLHLWDESKALLHALRDDPFLMVEAIARPRAKSALTARAHVTQRT